MSGNVADLMSQVYSTPFSTSTTQKQYTAQVRPYETIFQDEIVKADFYNYYRSKINELAEHYRKGEALMNAHQQEPFEDIFDLL